MNTYENSVKLGLVIKSDILYLLIEINAIQIRGKKLIVPASHTLIENDKSNILFFYDEKEDAEIITSSQVQNKYDIQLGNLSAVTTGTIFNTLGDCAAATAGSADPIKLGYTVTMEVVDEERKTVTHISDDADIDYEIRAEVNLEEVNPVA